jgi:hypothetical protein
VTYGDGYAFLTGWSSNRLVPLLRAVRSAHAATALHPLRAYRAQLPPRRAQPRCECALALKRSANPAQGDPNDPNSQAGPNGGRGFAVPATFADVDGSSVWMLKWCVRAAAPARAMLRLLTQARTALLSDVPRIAQQSGANVTFDVVRLPWEIYYSSPLNNNTNDTAARVIYTLEELGYDAVASAVFVYPARMQFMRYLLPHQSYGFQVVTTVPSWEPEGLFARLFKFGKCPRYGSRGLSTRADASASFNTLPQAAPLTGASGCRCLPPSPSQGWS